MPRYEWAYVTTTGVWLHCTDTPTLNRAVSDIRSRYPRVKVEERNLDLEIDWRLSGVKVPPEYDSVSGRALRVLIRIPVKAGNPDEPVAMWLIGELCHLGWEPFAVVAQGSSAYVHYFRLAIQDKP